MLGGWKSTMQVRDLGPQQRLEMTCKTCGHVHYLTAAIILKTGGTQDLYLDEVEKMSSCKSRGCWGRVRMAKMRVSDTSGFVGGMA